MALETLTLSARAGVAAAAAALGQLHYYDALDAQEAFDVLCKASGNEAGVAPRIPDHLNLARGWYKEALESRGEYRLSDAERDRVLRLPHVQNIVDRRYVVVCDSEGAPIPAEESEHGHGGGRGDGGRVTEGRLRRAAGVPLFAGRGRERRNWFRTFLL